MTYFEFISVAISLIFGFAVADILRGLVPAMQVPARYWPQVGWLIATFLLIAQVWVSLWRMKEISWTGLVFVYAFVNPALTTFMSRLLVTPSPHSVSSFKDSFQEIRRPFFWCFFAFCINAFVFPWFVGHSEWGSVQAPQIGALFGMGVAIVGVVFKSERTQYFLVVLTLFALATLTILLPAPK